MQTSVAGGVYGLYPGGIVDVSNGGDYGVRLIGEGLFFRQTGGGAKMFILYFTYYLHVRARRL